jgi:hypothetical protein
LIFAVFGGGFNKLENLFTRILEKHFNVEISDHPDFVICSNRGKPFEYMKYNCVRIMFMGENMSADFTVFDYCIGFDFLNFGDRYFRLPFALYSDEGKAFEFEQLTENSAYELLKRKIYFANFIYGHQSSHGMREILFERLNQYKHVVSPGSYLNNVHNQNGIGKRCSWKEKNEYLIASKFTIAGDSIVYPGFVTEKIVQPFEKHSIPVYFGNPVIDRDFNTKAFVWCKSESDIERVVEEVQFLDTHDDAYVEMLCQCPFNETFYLKKMYEELEQFLYHIFSQEPEQARRRVRYFCAESHERYLREYSERYGKTPEFVHKLKDYLKR